MSEIPHDNNMFAKRYMDQKQPKARVLQGNLIVNRRFRRDL